MKKSISLMLREELVLGNLQLRVFKDFPHKQAKQKRPKAVLKTLSRDRSRSPATSKMELFVKIVNSWKSLFIVKRHSILDVAGVLICHCYLSAIHDFQDFVNASLQALYISLYLYNFCVRHKLFVTLLTVF